MSYSKSKSGTWSMRPKIGNGPYCEAWITSYKMTVDNDPKNPWKVTISDVKGKMKVSNVKRGNTSQMFISYNYQSDGAKFISNEHSWKVEGGYGLNPFATQTSTGEFTGEEGTVPNLSTSAGTTNLKAHDWVDITYSFDYSYKGWVGGIDFSDQDFNLQTHYQKIPTLIPAFGAGIGKASASISIGSPRYVGYTIRATGTFSGLVKGNLSYEVYMMVFNKKVDTKTGSPTSGTLSGTWVPTSPGNYIAIIYIKDSNGNLTELTRTSFWVDYPPPTPPTMGNVNNTTPVSINTTRSKTLSANWGVSWVGYPAGAITYEWQCYSSVHGLLNSGTDSSTSKTFSWNVPQQHTGANIYWKVRAKNSVGWSGWVTSENREVFWAYNEPAKVTAGSVTPNRFQLFNGNTNINFKANANINGWGDRPGEKTMEFALLKNGSVLKWYGRSVTSSTGVFSQDLSYTVPETDLNSTYNVVAYKRLGGTEYTTSSNPKTPTTGDNHVTVGNITFYEVIGKVSGSFSLDPSVIISGLPSDINYSWTYDKQSSEKVDFYIEVYRKTTDKVTKTFNLDTNVTSSSSRVNKVSTTLVEAQQADVYEIRLKAKVTELLGNTNTYTLAVLTPEVYNPPVGSLSINNVSKPLPTTNATSRLAKQNTDITWDYTYSFQGVVITKVTLVVQSKPYGTEEFELEFNPTTSPYYNNFTRYTKGEFDLGSAVTARMRIYYQIIGNTRTWDVITDPLTINITPTRYLYFLTRVNYGEQQLNKIHPLVGSVDKTSKKIFLEDKE